MISNVANYVVQLKPEEGRRSVTRFVEKFGKEMNESKIKTHQILINMLRRYPWPAFTGNILFLFCQYTRWEAFKVRTQLVIWLKMPKEKQKGECDTVD